jgi:hypothetical protein
MDNLARVPLHPILLAWYPPLLLYSANLSEVLPVDVVAPLVSATVVSVGLLLVFSLLTRSLLRGALVASAVVVSWSFVGRATPALTHAGLSDALLLAGWIAAMALIALAALRLGMLLPRLTLGLNGLAIALVALTAVAILPYEVGRQTTEARALHGTDATLPTAQRLPGRDIYYLVFDRYGSDWSIRQHFGIQNDLNEWLVERGFTVVPGARANYRASDLSIASTLNMSYLDHLTEQMGHATGDRTPVRQMLQDHVVGRFLQAHGYRYLHVSAWYTPTLDNAIADEVLRWDRATELVQVLNDTSLRPVVDRVLGGEDSEPPVRVRHREFARYQFRQIQRAASHPDQVFVFAHVLLPHPPYAFRRDGSDMLLHEAESLPEAVLYEEQLAYTNARIRETVEVLLDRPSAEQPIIILQADEGPFLCRNVHCWDGTREGYGIRFGIQGAYLLPGLDDDVLSPDHSAVNTFRTILREYFGADLAPLPNRSFDWPDEDHLYDFRDVTHLLPLPSSR